MIAPILLINGMTPDADFGSGFMLFMLWTVLLSAVLTLRAGRMSAGKPGVETSFNPELVR